jgi:hypothetical protein
MAPSAFRGIKLHTGDVAKGQQLVACNCCMSAARMVIFSAENGVPVAAYSATTRQCMFVLSTLLKQLPNAIIVFTQVTSGHVHIFQNSGRWNRSFLAVPLVALDFDLPTSEKCTRVTTCNGRNATSGANRRPEIPRHHLGTSTVDGPVQPQLVNPSLARSNKLGPPGV